MKNTEIEKRYYVKDKKVLIRKLQASSKKLYKNHQIDCYYIPKHRNFLDEKYPFEWLRLREENNKFLLTYKHWYPEGVKESTHCDEFETQIEDGRNFENILKALDFEKIVTVDKVRECYDFNGFEIAIDDVKNLGVFVEVEIKSEYRSVTDALDKISRTANDLGLIELPKDHPVRTGYPLVLYKKVNK